MANNKISLPLGGILTMRSLDGSKELTVTDGNRSTMPVIYDRIGSEERMANGTLRGYYVTDKRSWSLSWDQLAGTDARVQTGGAGAMALLDFYTSNKGEFYIDAVHANSQSNYTTKVKFESFSMEVSGRQTDDYYSVSLSLTEV